MELRNLVTSKFDSAKFYRSGSTLCEIRSHQLAIGGVSVSVSVCVVSVRVRVRVRVRVCVRESGRTSWQSGVRDAVHVKHLSLRAKFDACTGGNRSLAV